MKFQVKIYALFLQNIPIVVQETEQRGITVRASSQHAEYQEQICLRKISIFLEDGNVQESYDLIVLDRASC